MKNPSSVALAGFLVLQAYFTEARKFIEPSIVATTTFLRAGIFDYESIGDSHAESRPHLDSSHFFRVRQFR